MKKIVMLAMATAFMFSSTVMAQTSLTKTVKESKEVKQVKSTVVVSAKARAEKVQKDLKLTNDQTSKVTDLFTKQDASIANLKSKEKVGSEAYKTKLTTIKKSGDTELKGIIGKEKFQQYEANIKAGEHKVKDKADSKVKSASESLKLK